MKRLPCLLAAALFGLAALPASAQPLDPDFGSPLHKQGIENTPAERRDAETHGFRYQDRADRNRPYDERRASGTSSYDGPRGRSYGSRNGAPGAFDFYVLALSWSPGFCASRGSERRYEQCDAGRRLGFVVHGLWPQYERGYPSNCGSSYGPSRAALNEAEGVYPDLGLARHEWRKHGTCSGLPAADYFRTVARARDLVRVPEAMTAMLDERRTAGRNIERAFVAANPGLRSDMMAVVCRRGALQEVRICLDRDLRGFRPCPEVARPGCGFGDIRVDAPR